MTQSTTKPFADFSDYQGDPLLSDDPVIKQKALDQASEDAAIAKALQDAKEAMKEKLIQEQEAPAVKAMKAKLVKPKKAAKTSPAKKAGRVVGISADENKFLQELLQAVLFDNNYATMINESQIAFDKLNARYNTK